MDLAYLTPVRQFNNLSGYKVAQAFNESGACKAIYDGLLEAAEEAKDSPHAYKLLADYADPVVEFVGGKTKAAVETAHSKTLGKYLNIYNSIGVEEYANTLAKVNSHYKLVVGSLYGSGFQCTIELGIKRAMGIEPNEEDYLGVGESWVSYEEIGLSGYSEANSAFYERLVKLVDDYMQNRGQQRRQGFLRAPEFSEPVNELVIYTAHSRIAKAIARGPANGLSCNPDTDAILVLAHAVRMLTKKAEEGKADHKLLFKTIKAGNFTGSRFDKQIAILSEVRL